MSKEQEEWYVQTVGDGNSSSLGRDFNSQVLKHGELRIFFRYWEVGTAAAKVVRPVIA